LRRADAGVDRFFSFGMPYDPISHCKEGLGVMYNGYFGFLESPFSVTPDPRFFYTNPVYQEAYANLRYGIEAKKGFIVITGEVGTGKTTLLRKLMHSLQDTIHTVFIFNTDLTFPELLQLILHDLGLAPKEPTKVSMLHELNEYLIKQLKQGHIVAVLIDEAQNLSDEALEGLRLLSNLETDQEKLIQTVLMGQPELERKLDRPTLRQLKQRVALRGRLAPLKDAEVGSYIDFRLRAAGYEGNGLFHPDAVQEIAFYSKGIPRLMNVICDNALLNVYAVSQRIVSADMVREVARDLRLGSEVQIADTETLPTVLVPETNGETPTRERANGGPQEKARSMLGVGVGTFLVFLLLVAAAVFGPQDFSISGRGLEAFKGNLSQWLVPATHEQVAAKKVSAEVDFKPNDRRVLVEPGSTIRKIASDAYGNSAILGMDLIKDFNPQINNLNRVVAGRELLLPTLAQETLLRKQPDGSYRLIVASFPSQTGAYESARRVGNTGHQVMITPKRVSDDLLLYRVEINGLKNLEEANQAWETGLKNEWFAFVGNSGGRDKVSGAEMVY
jgi:general secretion pathway protein A